MAFFCPHFLEGTGVILVAGLLRRSACIMRTESAESARLVGVLSDWLRVTWSFPNGLVMRCARCFQLLLGSKSCSQALFSVFKKPVFE